MERIVLTYSGDLDTTVAIPWLRDKHVEIVTVISGPERPSSPERPSPIVSR